MNSLFKINAESIEKTLNYDIHPSSIVYWLYDGKGISPIILGVIQGGNFKRIVILAAIQGKSTYLFHPKKIELKRDGACRLIMKLMKREIGVTFYFYFFPLFLAAAFLALDEVNLALLDFLFEALLLG